VIVKILRVLKIGASRKFGVRGIGVDRFHPHNWGGFLFPETRPDFFSASSPAKYQLNIS
jgi:hypothetical protein